MPTNRTHRRQARRSAYPSWILTALRTGRSGCGLGAALYALRHGLADIAAWRNREPDGRLDVAVVRTLWKEFGTALLAGHIERWPGTRPVPWYWWNQELVRVATGSTLEEIKDLLPPEQKSEAVFLQQHGLLDADELNVSQTQVEEGRK